MARARELLRREFSFCGGRSDAWDAPGQDIRDGGKKATIDGDTAVVIS